MSSDRMKPRSGDWAVMTDFLQEAAITLSSGSSVTCRIESDDEYDSELDDFIDDGPEETEDYSKHIREIFGYDKSKYNDFDEDDECMESNFGQVLKEEFNSAKIGIMEDLEDIKMEQMEKRKKMMKKKKLK
uniref:Protein SPT2 homolog n=1 Tax=Timema monikensis TaxID=170555 RepID=A0A7R9HPV6_9NEOP|nr:unnamed protein product [Timema monikensis]